MLSFSIFSVYIQFGIFLSEREEQYSHTFAHGVIQDYYYRILTTHLLVEKGGGSPRAPHFESHTISDVLDAQSQWRPARDVGVPLLYLTIILICVHPVHRL